LKARVYFALPEESAGILDIYYLIAKQATKAQRPTGVLGFFILYSHFRLLVCVALPHGTIFQKARHRMTSGFFHFYNHQIKDFNRVKLDLKPSWQSQAKNSGHGLGSTLIGTAKALPIKQVLLPRSLDLNGSLQLKYRR